MISKKILSGILAVTMLVASVPSVMVANANNEPAQTTNITPGTKTGTMTIRLKITSYSVTLSQELGGLNINKTSVNSGTAFSATLSAKAGYDLPDTISVKIGTTDVDSLQIECGSGVIASGDKITYNKSSGGIYIPAAMVTGNITITADGVAKKFDLVYKVLAADKDKCNDLSEKGITESDTNEGVKKTVSNGATFGQPVADAVTLTGKSGVDGKDYAFAGWYYDKDNDNTIDADETKFDFKEKVAITSDPINLIAKWNEVIKTPTTKGGDPEVAIADTSAQAEGDNSGAVKVPNSSDLGVSSIVVSGDNDGVTSNEKAAFNKVAAQENREVVPLVAFDISVIKTDVGTGTKTKVNNAYLKKKVTMTIKLADALPEAYKSMALYIYHQVGGGTDNIKIYEARYDEGTLSISFTLPEETTFSPFTLVALKAKSGSSVTGYTVTWDIDGVKTTEPYIENGTAEYKGETPTKAEDENYTYVFKGWDKPFTTIHSDMTYTAVFEKTAKTKAHEAVSEISVDNGTVSWQPAEDVVAYKVEKIIAGKKYYGSKVTDTSYSFKNAPNANYAVRVVAFFEDGTKLWSRAVTVDAEGSLGKAENITLNGKTVSWTAAENAKGYRIIKILNGKYYYGSYTTNTSYKLNNVQENMRIIVTAYGNDNNKTYSDEALLK